MKAELIFTFDTGSGRVRVFECTNHYLVTIQRLNKSGEVKMKEKKVPKEKVHKFFYSLFSRDKVT